jgi:hypothetical protein
LADGADSGRFDASINPARLPLEPGRRIASFPPGRVSDSEGRRC